MTKRRTIRYRLVLLVTACVLPASLMLAGFISHLYFQSRAALAQASLSTARAIVSTVDRELAGVQAGLLSLATSPYLTSGNLAAFYEQANDVLKTLNAEDILLIDPSSQQLLNTFRPFGSALPSESGHPTIMQVFQTARPFTTDLTIGMVAQQQLIVVNVPVIRDGKVLYVLASTLWPKRLSRILTQQRLAGDWIGVIFDSSGTIVARTHQMERFVGKKGAARVIARAKETAEDIMEVNSVEGISILSVFSRSEVTNWTVAIGIPSKLLTNQLWQTLAWLVVGVTMLLSTSLTLAWIIQGQIARPIHALAGPALALGSGDAVTVPPLSLAEADDVGIALTRASTMLKAAQHLANHDTLTGIANRAFFNEILSHQVAICKRTNMSVAILYVDLDGFKPINDVYGHAAGDQMLCVVATRLKNAIRESDLVARIGGDEFAVILVNTGLAAAQTVARKLTESLSAPYPIDAQSLTISASIGTAVFPESGRTGEALCQFADAEMYRVKAGGKLHLALA